MADWNEPTSLATAYATVLSILKAREVDALTLQVSAIANAPTGAIKWDRVNNKFQEWNGASFDDMVLSIAGGGTGAATAGAARTALGLGTMAVQNSTAVAITGGSIAGVTMDASVLTSGIVALSRGGTGSSLAIGANGSILQSNGAVVGFGTNGAQLVNLSATQLTSGNVPIARFPTSGIWAINALLDISGGPLTVRGFGAQIVNISATPYAPLSTDYVIQVNSTAGNKVIALPAALGVVRRILVIQKTVAANTVTITPNGAELIDGAATLVLSALYETVTIQSDGANWYTIATRSNASAAYPIGSVYINASVATNPNTLLGFGTWTSLGAGRVLVGVDAAQAEFATLGQTGGEKTHVLTNAESATHTHIQDPHTHVLHMPSGDGGFSEIDDAGSGNGIVGPVMAGASLIDAATATNQNSGGGGAHNNLQPYITVYMWLRTA